MKLRALHHNNTITTTAHGFVNNLSDIDYYNCLFTWPDYQNNKLDTCSIYPYKCRGMLCSAYYCPEVRKKIYYANIKDRHGSHVEMCDFNFHPNYKKFELILFYKNLNLIEESINKLNEINEKHWGFKQLSFEPTSIFDKKCDVGWTAGLLGSDSPGWAGSAPILSFITLLLRSGSVRDSRKNFPERYKNSPLFTDDQKEVEKFWSLEISDINPFASHDYGCDDFLTGSPYIFHSLILKEIKKATKPHKRHKPIISEKSRKI